MIESTRRIERFHRSWTLILLVWLGAGMSAALAADDCADAWITAKVKSKLMAAHGTDALNVNVETEQCVVTLEGCASTPEFANDAVQLARRVKGVREVKDAMDACPRETGRDGVAEGVDGCPDALITAQVKTLLLGATGLAAFDINVETEECVVTLEGCVDTAESRRKAGRQAAKAKGVKDVHNELGLCDED